MPPDSPAPPRRAAHGARRTVPSTRGMPRMVRSFMDRFSQERARDNAAGASAELQQRRHERDEVDAYLRDRHAPMDPDTR